MADKDRQAADAQYVHRVEESFSRQNALQTIGARLQTIRPGLVEIRLDFRPELGQQNGFLHAGMSTTIADTAGGYAAMTLFGPGEEVLTTEIKLNLLAPAQGDYFVGRGKVIKSGRVLSICQIEVAAFRAGVETLCAYGVMTAMRMLPR
jgi:uncharacterized protein (TIGR00369 family)